MKLKHIALSFTVAVCLALAACSDNGGDDDPPTPTAGRYRIAEIAFAVDADSIAASQIEADLEATAPWPVGGFHLIDNVQGLWSAESADSARLAGGTFVFEQSAWSDFPSSVALLLPRTQIYSRMVMDIERDGGGELRYYIIIARRETPTRMSISPIYDMWFYEDLTEHYRALHPGARVEAVVRAQVCRK